MQFTELSEFSRELKQLRKKYLTLSNDLEELKRTLGKLSVRNVGKHWSCLHKSEDISIYKIRLACRYLRTTTMRVVYARHAEPDRIVFLELYFKGDKENEDRDRIKAYLKTIDSELQN